MHLNIFVSKKCFVYCKGCYSYSREEKCSCLLPTDTIISFLKYAYSRKIDRVTLCGGDPLTRHDILELLKRIKDIGFYISMDTVGLNINRDIEKNGEVIYPKIDASQLSKLVDMIGIPIDGSNNEVINKFRPSNYDFINEQIKTCNKLYKYGANICINTVVHKGNLEDSINIAKLLKNLQYIRKWQFFQFSPIGGTAILNKSEYEISSDDFEKFKYDILNNINETKCQLEFKKRTDRINNYMLIDNQGNAWIPIFDSKIKNSSNRKIIGNISNREDWNIICNYIFLRGN